MDKKHQVHNLIILDESGSMEQIKKTIIQGFNEIVQTVKGIEKEFPEQEHFISLVTFNGIGQKLLHFIDPANKLEQIDETRYKPDASTPLYDAMGFSITKLRQILESQTNYNVLVTILTDGEENASKEYSGNDIKKLIEELKPNRWTFTYIGADHDVDKIAFSLSITNTMTFQKNEAHMEQMFEKEKSARTKYSQKIRMNEETSTNFYEPEDPKK
jgi:Mg-chelatase subunit ChlD